MSVFAVPTAGWRLRYCGCRESGGLGSIAAGREHEELAEGGRGARGVDDEAVALSELRLHGAPAHLLSYEASDGG